MANALWFHYEIDTFRPFVWNRHARARIRNWKAFHQLLSRVISFHKNHIICIMIPWIPSQPELEVAVAWFKFRCEWSNNRSIIMSCEILSELLSTEFASSSEATALQWRHNDHDSVSNHQPPGCLLNLLFRRRSKKTSKLRVTGLCVGNSSGPVNSPHKGPVTRKMFPFGDVIMTRDILWLQIVTFYIHIARETVLPS